MALKGDASQISLANIFQTLQLNGQEGVITITEGKGRRKIRLLPSGVRLLAQARDNPDVLRLALVKQKIVTESQFANIVSTMGQSPFPGDFLIARRILTRDQVEKDVLKQFLELVNEVFSWKTAKYEFIPGDPGDGLELFDPQDLGQSLIFNIPGILMEVARRNDEWARIRAEIREREIFAPVDRSSFLKPRTYHEDVAASVIEVKKLIDGEHTVEALEADSTLCSFEIFRAVHILIQGKEIRPLTLEEKKALAEDLRKKFKTREVIEIYRTLLDSDPKDIESRLKLVGILERKKENGLLVEQYDFLAGHFLEARDRDAALANAEKALAIDPQHLGALEKLFEVHRANGSDREAMDVLRRIVESVKARREPGRGADILLRAVDFFPHEVFLYHDLAEFLVLVDRDADAVAALKSAAEIYGKRGDLTKLRKTYERIVSLDATQGATLKRIAEAERRKSRPARSFLIPSRRVTAASLVIGLALGAGYLAAMEFLARRAYALVQPDVRTCAEAGDYRRARSILDEVARRYPLTTLPGRVAEEASRLATEQHQKEEARKKSEEGQRVQIGSFLARVETFLIGKRYMEAHALVKEMRRQPLSEENEKKVAVVETEIERYFSQAAELARLGRELVGAGRHEEAHREYMKLLMNYANTPAARGIRLPLLVRTTPSGARVSFAGETVGTTPLTVFYDPLAKFNLSVLKEGFRPVQFGEGGDRKAIDFTKDWQIALRLERIPAWIFDAQAPVECTPLVREDRAYIGTRGGRIYCLDARSGVTCWSYDLPDGWDVASGLRAHGDRLGFGTFEGAFHILDAKTGAHLHRLVPLTPPRPIRHPASETTEAGAVAVNCGGAAVAAVGLAAGTILWIYRPEADALGAPELHGGTIVFVSADGIIHVLDPASGSSLAKIPLGVRVEVAGRANDGSYIIGDAGGRIRRVDLKTGAIRWTYESPLENLTPPAIGGGLVFLGSSGGLIAALDEKTGDLRWKGKVNDAILASATWANGNFYLGTRSGQAICLEGAGGSPVWSFSSGGALTAAPGGGNGLVLFGSDDHKVYAFAEK